MADPSAFWDWRIGDVATWAGALGSAAAAGAAWLAASKAVSIAQMPLRAAEAERVQKARIIAPAIVVEMREVASECGRIERGADGAFQNSVPEGRRFLESVNFGAMGATERSMQFINAFSSRDAALVLTVYAEMDKLRIRMESLAKVPTGSMLVALDLAARNQAVRAVVDQAREAGQAAGATIAALGAYIRE